MPEFAVKVRAAVLYNGTSQENAPNVQESWVQHDLYDIRKQIFDKLGCVSPHISYLITVILGQKSENGFANLAYIIQSIFIWNQIVTSAYDWIARLCSTDDLSYGFYCLLQIVVPSWHSLDDLDTIQTIISCKLEFPDRLDVCKNCITSLN